MKKKFFCQKNWWKPLMSQNDLVSSHSALTSIQNFMSPVSIKRVTFPMEIIIDFQMFFRNGDFPIFGHFDPWRPLWREGGVAGPLLSNQKDLKLVVWSLYNIWAHILPHISFPPPTTIECPSYCLFLATFLWFVSMDSHPTLYCLSLRRISFHKSVSDYDVISRSSPKWRLAKEGVGWRG